MRDLAERIGALSPLKRAILTIEELEERLRLGGEGSPEPIAVIGLGCRFPGGGDGPEAFWRLLAEGVDASVPVPADRWDIDAWYDADRSVPGKMNMRRAGFLPAVDRFDPRFFGIAPREAASIDPQHRLLLEVAWEALEDAGIRPDRLDGSPAGVFVGLYANNYTLIGRGGPDAGVIDAWSAAGGHSSAAPGRVSYLLGLTGPSLAVDTACSSSLVAVHLAVRSLLAGECDLALAGGVHLLLFPEALVASTKLGATAPDGRCKAFDAAADGFGHGEGCGIVVLKRLSDARAAGDRVLAVIRGSAVNQDGRSSSLTAPNGVAQENVVRAAIAKAGVSPALVGYVEAHGTGTPLGDPIEANALSAVYGPGRARPLRIGSVKTNLGHLEAAAGIAGLIKVVLALGHRQIPPSLHFRTWNPEIERSPGGLEIPGALGDWEPIDGRRVAGVSAFGFAGTNAHVVVEEAPDEGVPSSGREGAAAALGRAERLLVLSARDEASLAELAGRWDAHLATSPGPWPDLCWTAATGRARSPVRMSLVAADPAEARARLAGALAARHRAAVTAGTPRLAFLFTGQGSQYAGMGRELDGVEPLFTGALDRCEEALAGRLGRPLRRVLFDEPALLGQTRFAQVALFALEYSLAAVLEGWGIRPAALLGHSLGEYVAAAVAGVLPLEEAIGLVETRGRLMQALPAGGAMAALFCGSGPVHELLARTGGSLGNAAGVSVAAENGPSATVVSGPEAGVAWVEQELSRRGGESRRLDVSHAFHSGLIEPALPGLERAASSLAHAAPRIPVIGNLTGRSVDVFDASYWSAHARGTVRFAEGIATLQALGCGTFVEVGPQPVLLAMAREVDASLAGVGLLRRGVDGWRSLLEAVGWLFTRGIEPRWEAIEGGRTRGRVSVPRSPFRRERFWLEERRGGGVKVRAEAAVRPGAASQAAPEGAARGAVGSPVVSGFYDELTVISADGSGDEALAANHLTFGFLPEPVPGFSWLLALFGEGEGAASRELLLASQGELKEALFAGVDFANARRVLDFGCGHAADLCTLAARHPHLELDGFTISAAQVEVGRRRVRSLGAEERVRIHHGDSARDPFPGLFDVVFGFEVSGLIEDKEALFGNVGSHLAPGGLLILADFLATDAPIASPLTHSYTSTAEEWAALLARERLRVVEAVDASAEVGNWLLDPGFEGHLDEVVRRHRFDALSRRHLASNENIGKALRGGLIRYLLIRAVRDQHHDAGRIERDNLSRLAEAPSRAQASTGGAERFREWIYRVDWKGDVDAPEGPRAEELLLSPGRIAASEAVAGTLDRERSLLAPFSGVGRALDLLSVDFVTAALLALGCRTASEGRRASVAPAYRRLLARLVEILDEEGIERLPEPDGQGPGQGQGQQGAPEARCLALAESHPEVAAELALLGRCGPRLAEVLSGLADPLPLLFPDADAGDAEALYEKSPFSGAMGRLAGECLAAALSGWSLPPGPRILEVGAGTGATTSHLLSRLPFPPREYDYTDISPTLLARAEGKFRGRGPLRFRRLDISADPEGQGFEAGRYDVVVAANVLHATPSLVRTLEHVKGLLAPGGLLLLVETTGKLRWGELTFGLTEGMWCFTDTDLRPAHALLAQRRWLDLLASRGFEEPVALCPGEPDRGGVSQQSIFLARAPRAGTRGRWILVGGSGEAMEQIGKRIEERGDSPLVVGPGDALPATGAHDRVVYLGAALGEAAPDPVVQDALRGALELTQALLRQGSPASLTLVTRGAHHVAVAPGEAASDRLAGLASSTLIGFARGVATEHPELSSGLVDLDPALAPGEQAAALVAELSRKERGSEVALRRGAAWTPRLVRSPGRPAPEIAFDPERPLLVTGGLGGLGLLLARWLVDRGAREISLVGRSAPSAGAVAAIRELEARSARVRTLRADVGRREEVARALAEAGEGLPSLAGVFHAAGVLDDGVLLEQSWDRFPKVLAPKVAGAWHLHELTREIPLLRFVLFSSAAGLLGSPGQGNHAAANTFLDALAHHRRSLGLPALSVDWGAWGEAGAAVRPGVAGRPEQLGLFPMPPGEALEALEVALAGDEAQVAIIAIDWGRYLERFRPGKEPSLLSALRPSRSTSGPARPVESENFRQLLDRVPQPLRRERLASEIALLAAKVMGLAPDERVEEGRPLREMGLDSLMSIELRNLLGARAGTKLPATLLFEHPTVQALVSFLVAGSLRGLVPEAAVPAKGEPADLEGLDAAQLAELLDREISGSDGEEL